MHMCKGIVLILLLLLSGIQTGCEKQSTEEVANEQIVIDQIGYLPEATKEAVFINGQEGEYFQVVDIEEKKVVYTGKLDKKGYSVADEQESCIGDFSMVTKPGHYKVIGDKGESYAFSIGQDVYKEVFNAAMKFFYYQRCGTKLTEEYAGAWKHDACHTEKATIYGTDKKIDVSGGWHDAGDYGRYVVPIAKTVADLMLAYESNPEAFGDDLEIPESGNGVPDVLDEVKYQLEWLLKMQDPESGGVYHKVTCRDFPGFVKPEEETDELIVCPITTTATGDFAAAMSIGYTTYKTINPDFANQCLQAAESAWTYLEQTPPMIVSNPEGIVTGAYDDGYDYDERIWANVELFRATGDLKYHKLLEGVAPGLENEKMEEVCYGWRDVITYAMDRYLSCMEADEEICKVLLDYKQRYIEALLEQMQQDPYHITNEASDYYWGSNMYILGRGMLLDEAYQKDKENQILRNYAIEQVHYCLGKNPLNRVYVTGYGSLYPQNPHHRLSIAAKQTIPGMLVGGANKYLDDACAKEKLNAQPAGKCYIDDYESYSTNEVAIYWNSSLVYALAKLRLV